MIRYCINCGGTWNVSGLDGLCEDCGVALANAEHRADLEGQAARAGITVEALLDRPRPTPNCRQIGEIK